MNHPLSPRKFNHSRFQQDTVAASPTQISPYRNALEPLVAEEIQRQLHRLPSHIVQYINPTQILAYALNRLPALYATSEEGWHRQQQRAIKQLGDQIVVAVRQGLVAVQQDPLKASTPLKNKGNLDWKTPVRKTRADEGWDKVAF